ncbi:MAG: protein-disulfide reductase DsbD domain-containing protein [Rhodospirillaceae bacterium]
MNPSPPFGSPLILMLALMPALMLAPLLPRPAAAAASDWGRAEMVEARLVSATAATGGGATVPLGLQVRLWPGWKTYWRSPGDAGLPPRLDWTGSANLERIDIAWPAPVRFSVFGLETFGYEGTLVLPLTARLTRPGAPLALKAAVDLLVCHDICVPAHFDLALALPAGPATADAEAGLIAGAVKRVPGDGREAGLTLAAVRDASGPDGPAVEIEATAREPFGAPDVFLEAEAGQAFRPPELHVDLGNRRLTARLALLPPPAGAVRVDSFTGRTLGLTLVDGARSLEARAVVAAAAPTGPALAPMLGLALLGGLILNLMPCVLPVLSLKLLAVVGHGGGSVRAVRAGFLASAAGILASFLGLALAMIGLKTAGAAAGWGIQFQQPLFLGLMTVVVAGFAANLWGLFEIPLPRAFAVLAERDGAGAGGLAGPFVTGIFATLLATPCSAPFLGTAVGFALARGPVEIIAVFLCLGLGLAGPYLLVAALPRLATRLPRPGRWMLTLRRVLGLALAATALWLGWLLTVSLQPPAPAAGQTPAAHWQPFDPARVRSEVGAGHVVFVDVTADWCLTCLANQRLVLDQPAIAARLGDPSGAVLAMRADWTRPDEAISRYLASFGRYGVPFNAVYGPGAPEGLPLPELLSAGAVLDGLARAAAPAGH